MNIEEYISGGVVEAYVLGIASDDEIRELEHLLPLHPELGAAIEEQEKLLGQYAEAHAIAPPQHLKQHIWESLNAGANKTEEIAPTPKIPLNTPLSAKKPNYYARAAAILLIVSSGIANVRMMQQNKEMKAETARLAAEQKAMAEEKTTALAAAQKANEAMQVLSLPALKRVNLAGVGTHTAHSGMLYWDGATGNVFLDLNSMPKAPEGKQYQLWAIVDGKPVDAGMYNGNMDVAMQKMKTIAKAEMFAITIEKAGGSPTPTLDQMVVAGKTS